MPEHLLDTDHVTLIGHGHPRVMAKLAPHSVRDVAVGIVSVEESLRGRLAALASVRDGATRILKYKDLHKTVRLFRRLPIVAFSVRCEVQFQQLLALRLRVGAQDLKIAAIALTQHLTLLTRSRRDFGRIPGLLLDDWSM